MTATEQSTEPASEPKSSARPDRKIGAGQTGGLLTRRYGSTSLRVGAASIWLSIIVLLPLAAIVWQSAGGGWTAFWNAITSNAAVSSFKVTLGVSFGVAVINLFFGLLVAWVLT
ncbi:molybdate ABC transporter permease subunit, partial [Mycobacteroides chelonae]